MGLSTSNIHFLALTRRKADCEYGLACNATRKMLMSREMSDLAREYNSKMGQKMVVYNDNGQYQEINYSYLMGYGNASTAYGAIVNGDRPLKNNNSMILTDPQGHVVVSDWYAKAITAACGVGYGEPFSEDLIPDVLTKLFPGRYTREEFQTGMTECHWSGTATNTLGESESAEGNSDTYVSSGLQAIIDFYVPIFKAAAVNGWTTKYNESMSKNPHYLTDALASGALILAKTNEEGYYDENATLTYFATAGDVEIRPNTSRKAELEAEYEEKRAEISEKEELLDLEIADLNAEFEAIKTEMESIKTFIQDAVQSVFNWGTSS